MCGDVNIFLHEYIPDDSGEIEVYINIKIFQYSYLKIMIAEKDSRRKGLASLSLKIMMDFTVKYIKRNKFIAKINMSNNSSIKLFEKMGYKKV